MRHWPTPGDPDEDYLRFGQCGWLSLAAWGAWFAPLCRPYIPTAPIHTNKLKFRIPFHYDAAELTRASGSDGRFGLHVFARPRPNPGRPYQDVAPDAGKFSFDAPADGEYWFIVRTLDAKKNIHPAGRLADPDLKVIVDTTLPRLDLELRRYPRAKCS